MLRTLADCQRKSRKRDYANQPPLHPGDTRLPIRLDKGMPPGTGSESPNHGLSSDRSLQPDSVKLDLVIAHQPWRGEYVPGPCTHRPSSHGSRGCLKSVTARIGLGKTGDWLSSNKVAVPEGALEHLLSELQIRSGHARYLVSLCCLLVLCLLYGSYGRNSGLGRG